MRARRRPPRGRGVRASVPAVTLSEQSLEWLRTARSRVPAAGESGDEVALAMGVAAALLAQGTPAWVEHEVAVLDDLTARTPTPGALRLVLLGLRSMTAADPAQGTEASELAGALASAGTGSEPERLALLGLGLLLQDRQHGTDHHRAVLARLTDAAAQPAHTGAGDTEACLRLAFLLAPQAPERARALFDTARTHGLPSPSSAAYALVAARAWGLTDLQPDLRAAAAATGADTETETGTVTAGHEALHDAVLAVADAIGPDPARFEALWRAPLRRWPQVVDVEVPAMALRGAEWRNDCLCLVLAPAETNRARFTQFRLVGTELRVWCQTGVDGVRTDVTGHGVVVAAPLVAGPLEFTPGSY